MPNILIQTRGLTKRFGDISVLSDINLDIYEGEIFGIIGKSGVGKSTFARLLNDLEHPTAGDVFFDGKAISGLKRRELYAIRRSMGMIFQQFNLLMQKTVLENVCFPLSIAGYPKGDARKRARELLGLVGLADKENSYPAKLSGGQKQRVAIARAIAPGPKLLILDEATSALDPETTRGILKLLRDINRRFSITMLVITHEMRVIEELCGRVAILDQNRIAELGAVAEVFSNPRSEAGRALIAGDGEDAAYLLRVLRQKGLTVEEALNRVCI